MNRKTALWILLLAFVVLNAAFLIVFAHSETEDEEDDITLFGLELEELLSFVNGVLALVLFVITFTAYQRDRRARFLYVSVAFLLFAVRSFLEASELVFDGVPLLDPITVVLDFVILLAFFYGLLRT